MIKMKEMKQKHDAEKQKHDDELKNQADLARKDKEEMNEKLRQEINQIRMMIYDSKMGIQPTTRMEVPVTARMEV